MDKLERRVLQTVKEYHMLEPGDQVLAALSGGADSVCLLALLWRFKNDLGIELSALHVHHGLREGEADRDAAFAEDFCQRLGIPCRVIRADVRGYGKERGLSEEEAGRRIRYEALEAEADRLGGPVRIAVAHHRGDQAETILHNLLRGSGLGGLGGIPYVRGRIIRPLLDTDRREILEWLKKNGFGHVEDSTNSQDHYTRNRIRGYVLPVLEEEVNRGAAGSLIRLGHMASMADSYLEERAAEWRREHEGVPYSLPAGELLKADPVIRCYVVMGVIRELAGASRDLGWIHVEQALGLLDRPVGRMIQLPYGLRVRREYESLRFYRDGEESLLEGESILPEVSYEIFSYENGKEFPKNMYTKWFDCDRIKGTPVLRTREQGDYIELSGGIRKTLKRFMIDEKIPRDIRDRIPLLADGSHVMWIIGYRISSYYKLTPDTRRVLQAEIRSSIR